MDELIKTLRRLKVQTGSLACFGCGHEHSCSVRGCAIIRSAADLLEQQQNEIASLRQINGGLQYNLQQFGKNNPSLTEMQQKIYDYISETIFEQGYPPTMREIGDAVGLKSPSTVYSHLKHMEEKGVISKGSGKGRAIRIIMDLDSVVGAIKDEAVSE